MREALTGFRTLLYKEVLRFWKVSVQTVAAPVLTALLVESTRIRGGLMVTANTFRHPAMLAKIVTTLDRISRGRVELGLGARF